MGVGGLLALLLLLLLLLLLPEEGWLFIEVLVLWLLLPLVLQPLLLLLL